MTKMAIDSQNFSDDVASMARLLRSQPSDSATSRAVVIGRIVVSLWIIFLVTAIAGPWFTGTQSETWGQIGDTFGVINSLFTSLALVGLVYTANLQREEMRITREAISRESREQFLTARLTAASCLMAPYETELSRLSVDIQEDDPRKRRAEGRLSRLSNRIGILNHEALLGFEPRIRFPQGEEAAYRHLVDILVDLCIICRELEERVQNNAGHPQHVAGHLDVINRLSADLFMTAQLSHGLGDVSGLCESVRSTIVPNLTSLKSLSTSGHVLTVANSRASTTAMQNACTAVKVNAENIIRASLDSSE